MTDRDPSLDEDETEVVTDPRVEFLSKTLMRLIQTLSECSKEERKVQEIAMDAAFRHQEAIWQGERFIDAYKAAPELFAGIDVEQVRSLKYYLRRHKEDLAEDPLEVLLNWKTEGSDLNFIGGELYELIGKDAARTFRALLRALVLKYEPLKADRI